MDNNNLEISNTRAILSFIFRLAYCARFDFRWYFYSPHGLRGHVKDVLYHSWLVIYSVGTLLSVLAVLFFRPFLSPLHWLWHATANAKQIEKMMGKTDGNS